MNLRHTFRIPPLAALRAFEAVARLGGVVEAAAELHLTHSAISHQLRSLEENLGRRLLERHGRRLQLTEGGRVYALQVRYALHDLAKATGQVLSRSHDDELVIGTLPSFGAHWLVSRLPSLLTAAPRLQVSVRASLALADLDDGGLDLAIRMGSGGWERVQQRPLFHDRLVAVASPTFNGGELPRTPAEFIRAPLLLSIENWRPWLECAGLAPNDPAGLHFNDSNLLLEAVRQGLGVALARQSLVHDALREGRLLRPIPISAPYPAPYWLVWSARTAGQHKLAVFSDWIDRQVATYLDEVAASDAQT